MIRRSTNCLNKVRFTRTGGAGWYGMSTKMGVKDLARSKRRYPNANNRDHGLFGDNTQHHIRRDLVESMPINPDEGSVLALIGSNDVRLHDNYALAMAIRRAKELNVPLACVFCFDMRMYAQPSLVGGFFRASPMRAKFMIDCVEDLRESLATFGVRLIVKTGLPEEEVAILARKIKARECFTMTQHAPHEALVHKRLRKKLESDAGCVLNKVWGSTAVHPDDLAVPFGEINEGLRFFFDEFQLSSIRPTEPYDCDDGRLNKVGQAFVTNDHPEDIAEMLQCSTSGGESLTTEEVHAMFELPTLGDLGYGDIQPHRNQELGDAYGFVGGETSAIANLKMWVEVMKGLDVYVPPGYSQRLSRQDAAGRRAARLSPFISTGALSPRKFNAVVRHYCHTNSTDGAAQPQYQEFLLRLARRDYWHYMGLKYGRTLFFPYGPTPESTYDIPDYKMNEKIIRKWCAGLTGVPFCDAGMRELVGKGFTSAQARQALAWQFSVGFGQDWRIGAEWFERCSLDYDPFVCYGEFARCSKLIKDEFGETVHTASYLAGKHDQTGRFVRQWLPQLMSVPTMYIHRPHVMTKRMQSMHSVKIGAGGTYPLPMKLWDGAQHKLGPSQLPAYFATREQQLALPGWGEAEAFGTKLLPAEQQPPFKNLAAPTESSSTTLGQQLVESLEA